MSANAVDFMFTISVDNFWMTYSLRCVTGDADADRPPVSDTGLDGQEPEHLADRRRTTLRCASFRSDLCLDFPT